MSSILCLYSALLICQTPEFSSDIVWVDSISYLNPLSILSLCLTVYCLAVLFILYTRVFFVTWALLSSCNKQRPLLSCALSLLIAVASLAADTASADGVQQFGVHRSTCLRAYGILSDQGSSLFPALPGDSQPLDYQGSPYILIFM